jgi:hypothetical protein
MGCARRLTGLQVQLAAAKQEAATAHSWHQRWEAVRMEVEDLAAANRRAMMRRHELVASYWPVMARLNLAEDAAAALTQQVRGGAPVLGVPLVIGAALQAHASGGKPLHCKLQESNTRALCPFCRSWPLDMSLQYSSYRATPGRRR